jgi:hypothetical protein
MVLSGILLVQIWYFGNLWTWQPWCKMQLPINPLTPTDNNAFYGRSQGFMRQKGVVKII